MDNIDDPWNLFHQCKLCNYKTRFLHCILRHVRLHRTRTKSHCFACDLHSPEKHQCEKCGFQSDFKVLLKEHFNTVHETIKETYCPTIPGLRSCRNCDFETYSALVLLNHSCDGSGLPVKEENSIQCDKGNEFSHCSNCSYKTVYSKSLKFHTSSEPIVWFKCNNKRCSYKTKTKHALHKHMLTRHRQPAKLMMRCKFDQCSYEAITKTSIQVHMRQEHWIEWYLMGQRMHRTVEPREFKYFTCDQCSYKATRRDHLRDHILWEHSPSEQINWVRCELCSYISMRKDDLSQHILAQHMETENAKVFYNGILISRKHTPAEQINCLKCELCSYISMRKDDLRRHILAQHMETVKAQVFYEEVLISL